MIIQSSLLQELHEALPHLRAQMYFKSSLTALSHAIEDQVLAGNDQPLVIACFQRERFYRQESHRYLRIADLTPSVFVLAAPETDFRNDSGVYESIAFDPEDGLSQEWHLVVISPHYTVCLICREHGVSANSRDGGSRKGKIAQTSAPQRLLLPMDQSRRFEGVWTFDREVSCTAAELLLHRISRYRPELLSKTAHLLEALVSPAKTGSPLVHPSPFTDRLVTYLQASQYRQLKAYRQIEVQERKERLVNSMTSAIRRSLNVEQVLSVAVNELGQVLSCDRCIIYQCQATDEFATIEYEFVQPEQASLLSQHWPLEHNPWFNQAVDQQEWVSIEEATLDLRIKKLKAFKTKISQAQIHSLLMVPVFYQGKLLGMVELHHTDPTEPYRWNEAEIGLVEAIATQVGVALIQSQSYAELEVLNQQLEALERARSNLIAITGHELRTPLSTIQVCLESLSNEPDMPLEIQQVMLSTALTDAERLRKLVQDFLTLSRLESGRVQWHTEALSLAECIELALSSTRARTQTGNIPEIQVKLPPDLPMIQADGEWLVEVLAKLLDNACKFTESPGKILIQALEVPPQTIEVVVSDTGRGIEPDRLETVFERFYQEEGALRRTTGGTGLGLAICRQIIRNLGGKIWADSSGKDQGSAFHFTLPSASARTASSNSSLRRVR
ncbi:MAG: ATP-binding protein [Thermosynechococcaceae cyanobacterium MS004]|nr:ATP-binding protein [Thermosynechococcaceae cyanobacterium MS004]